MAEIWFTADQHFGHENILKFQDDVGLPIRQGFEDVKQMDEFMIQMWNETVKPGDKIYQLGDFAMKAELGIKYIKRLNGKKRWVPGNHDPIKELAPYFEKVQIWRIFKDEGFVCTHIPIPPAHFRHKVTLNVHGHTHQNIMPEPHYKNICVENTGYKPVHISELTKIAQKLRADATED